MSYNSSTGIISAPVSIDDVKTALGESSNDLATLCTSSNINMWSKCKPTLQDNAFYDTATDAVKAKWFNGKNNNFNINLPLIAGNSTFDTLIKSETTYTVSSPYRLGDFKNYSKRDYWNTEASKIYVPVNVYMSGNIKIDDSVACNLTIIPGADTIPNIYEMLGYDADGAHFGFHMTIKTASGTTTTICRTSYESMGTLDLNTLKNFYNGSTAIGTYQKPTDGIFAMNINFVNSYFKSLVGATISIVPIVANYAITSGNGDGYNITPLIIQGSAVPTHNTLKVYKQGTLELSNTFIAPTVTFTYIATPSYSSSGSYGKYTLSNIVVKATNEKENGKTYVNYYVSTVAAVFYTYNSTYNSWVAVGGGSTSLANNGNSQFTLAYAAGSSTTKSVSVGLSVTLQQAKQSKMKVVVTASIVCLNNSTSFNSKQGTLEF